jgi:hypothetical protein
MCLALIPLTASADPKATTWGNASDWAYEELCKAEGYDLIPEVFIDADLTKTITRAEFAAVAVKVYEAMTDTRIEIDIENPFTDTNSPEVVKAYGLGLTGGVSADKFEPDTSLNREQMATMLTRVLKRAYIPDWTLATDGQYKLNFESIEPFYDDPMISAWAKESVYFMASKLIILGVGDNSFAPKAVLPDGSAGMYVTSTATCEQALIIGVRMVERLKDKAVDYTQSGA